MCHVASVLYKISLEMQQTLHSEVYLNMTLSSKSHAMLHSSLHFVIEYIAIAFNVRLIICTITFSSNQFSNISCLINMLTYK